MKLLVMPSSFELIKKVNCDGFIIGLNGLSVNMPVYFAWKELVEIINYLKKNNKDIFIALNKNMHNSDLEYLKKVMFDLDKIGVNGILYYDIALINIKQENNLKVDLVWAQEHMTTNYMTSNYWNEMGALYTLLSSEITIEEIIEFKKGSLGKLILPIFGYLPMFVSKRNLVKNYLKYFSLDDDSKLNYIEKEGNIYPIVDSSFGTVAYSSNILNGIGEVLKLKEIKMDYILLNSFNISEELFIDIVNMFNSVNNENVLEYSQKIDGLLKTDKGFLYQETIYKVKKNEWNK